MFDGGIRLKKLFIAMKQAPITFMLSILADAYVKSRR